MDVPALTITLHPLAKDYLFKHYYTLRRIFSNVLGQLETDYMSIALIDSHGQLIFLSSNPGIEQNLIEKEIWLFDGSYQADFVYQDKAQEWSKLYNPAYKNSLYKYKQATTNLKAGFSIPTNFGGYRVVFSFGVKSNDLRLKNQIIDNQQTLLAMGKFCLQDIMQSISLPEKHKIYSFKPRLTLVINNKVKNENYS